MRLSATSTPPRSRDRGAQRHTHALSLKSIRHPIPMLDALGVAPNGDSRPSVRGPSVEPRMNKGAASEKRGARPAHPAKLNDRVLGKLIEAREQRGRDELGKDERRYAAGYIAMCHGVQSKALKRVDDDDGSHE